MALKKPLVATSGQKEQLQSGDQIALSDIAAVTANSITNSLSPAPTGDAKFNEFYVTALANNATFSAPSGSPVNGNRLVIRIIDAGTAKILAWNAIYRASSDMPLPLTTVISKEMYLQFIYNSRSSTWDFIGFLSNF